MSIVSHDGDVEVSGKFALANSYPLIDGRVIATLINTKSSCRRSFPRLSIKLHHRGLLMRECDLSLLVESRIFQIPNESDREVSITSLASQNWKGKPHFALSTLGSSIIVSVRLSTDQQ